VVAIGSIMIPALIKTGYDERFSIGLTTASGSLGIVIPPSIPMILYCLVMNTSIAEMFMAGFLPGLLIGSVFIAYAIAIAYKHRWFFGEPVSFRDGLRAVRDGLWGLMLPVLVLGGIYTGMFTPTEAAAVSVVYALFVELVIYREMKLADVPGICKQGAILSSCLLFILACAMTLIWLLTAERIPHQFADLMTTHIGSRWLFLLLVNIFFLLFGCIGDNVSAMMILSPLFAETLVRFEIDPVHFGIITVLLIEYGFLTPPFGINLFVAMGLTKKSLTEVSVAVWPFLVLLLLCVLLVTYVPWISLVLPETFLR
jgi:C4-dicarboxylate transporter, DctM subunit